MNTEIYELFKVCKVDETQLITTGEPYLGLIKYGLVLDFIPSTGQRELLKSVNGPISVKTFFSHEERHNSDPFELITKQILHYIEVYGFGEPGEFSQLSYEGDILPVKIVRGVTADELNSMVQKLLYSNAPIKDTEQFAKMVHDENILFDLNKVQNNELRIRLYNEKAGETFESGDDAVRFIVFKTTGDTNLIKSKEVLAEVRSGKHLLGKKFLADHETVLAQVFNRHKRIILSLKDTTTKTMINRITRSSKRNHVPIREAINKTYVAKALAGNVSADVLYKVSARDKFKFLNALSWKKEKKSFDAYTIRNGKVHLDKNRKVYDLKDIQRVERDVLESLRKDFAGLSDKSILLDANVDFGLPTSRKQTLGNLPFGTRVTIPGDAKISSGMYWENSWGATDLDLSTVDKQNNRVGWGSFGGYDDNQKITFSGDVTYADDGAMEFMTSGNDSNYGLFVNVYSGNTPCDLEVVVGTEGKGQWINDVLIREKHTLKSRGEIIGFVQGKDFVVYHGRLNNKIANFGSNPIVEKATVNIWTVKRLLGAIGVSYVTEQQTEKVDYDLRYENFSFDKLEGLFGA